MEPGDCDHRANKVGGCHFHETDTLEHIGMTTWSGNGGMMAVAEKLGFLKEGQIRKVRYYQGQYYDSVKYGVLREEWATRA